MLDINRLGLWGRLQFRDVRRETNTEYSRTFDCKQNGAGGRGHVTYSTKQPTVGIAFLNPHCLQD